MRSPRVFHKSSLVCILCAGRVRSARPVGADKHESDSRARTLDAPPTARNARTLDACPHSATPRRPVLCEHVRACVCLCQAQQIQLDLCTQQSSSCAEHVMPYYVVICSEFFRNSLTICNGFHARVLCCAGPVRAGALARMLERRSVRHDTYSTPCGLRGNSGEMARNTCTRMTHACSLNTNASMAGRSCRCSMLYVHFSSLMGI